MDPEFPELNTESDTALEQPDLDLLRQERLDRNRKFLQSVSSSTAARVLSKDQSTLDVRDVAAITIQKNWKRALAQKLYVNMLYEKYMKEEEEQRCRMRQQVEEGELLVENHELEVLLDDNKTTRRNAERRLISKVITIQRAWKAYQERERNRKFVNLKDGNTSSDRENEAQGHRVDPVNSHHSNNTSSRSKGRRNPFSDKNPFADNVRDFAPEREKAEVDSEDYFVNPLSDNSSYMKAEAEPTSNLAVLKQLPRETDEDYQRRLRKHSLLSQAKQFIQLKKENSNALPFNLHMHDRDTESERSVSGFRCNHRVGMESEMLGECEVLELNRNSSKENQIKGNEKPIPSIEIQNETDCKNEADALDQSENTNPETKGGHSKCESEKGDNSKDASEKGDNSNDVSEKGDNSKNESEKGDNSNDASEKGDNSIGAFDVYNIETALPDMDWKNLEEKLIAARKEEEERLKARRNDREEIRKKLAMGGDDDDLYDDDDNDDDDDDISYKKPNLQSRLHSGLQICFMNESPGDTDSEGLSPRQHEIHDNMKLVSKGDDIVDSDNNLKSVTDLNRTAAGTSEDKSSTPPRLKSKLLDQAAKSDDFQSRQEQLQEEAKLALAQAGTMARMQLEIEKQTQKKSPMAEMVGIPGLGERRRKKLGLRKLQEMNLASIQVLYNDLQTQIENLNEELVHLLMERDELHMEQDSMLVDIEDLTRRAEELAEKSNAKANAKNSKNHVTGKVGGR